MDISCLTCSSRRSIGGISLCSGSNLSSERDSRPGHPDPSSASLPAISVRPRVLLPLDLLVFRGAIFFAPQAIFCCKSSASSNRYAVGWFASATSSANAQCADSIALFDRMDRRVIRRPAFQMRRSQSGLLPPEGIGRRYGFPRNMIRIPVYRLRTLGQLVHTPSYLSRAGGPLRPRGSLPGCGNPRPPDIAQIPLALSPCDRGADPVGGCNLRCWNVGMFGASPMWKLSRSPWRRFTPVCLFCD